MEQPAETREATGTVAVAMAAALVVAVLGSLAGFWGRKWVIALILGYGIALGAWIASVLRGTEQRDG